MKFFLNKDYSDLWVVDVIRFLALGLRRMSFGMSFLLPRLRKMSYLCIVLNLSGTELMLQIKISYGLANIVVIDTFGILHELSLCGVVVGLIGNWLRV